jgi:NAD(P)-dependent dehydrogenase (short-subunit alcohol dehydrogenase family)
MSVVAGDPGRVLDGKVALITGASRGVGRATAFALAAAGAEVIVVSRRAEACTATAHDISTATGRPACALPANVSRWDECDSLVSAAYRRFERIDILVNNAGSSPTYREITDVSESMFDKVIGLNLKGPFRITALVGTRMSADLGGAIVNVSTISASTGSPRAMVYAAAKAGLNNVTRSFAELLAPRTRVNAVMPGAIATDVISSWSEQQIQQARARTLVQRIGQPADISQAVLFLVGPGSDFITGQVLTIDGGRRAW